ncbi:MAG: AraC family transcriptional regulator [Myxococcales bacterium]
MLSLAADMTIRIERGRSALRVIACTDEGGAASSIEVTFSGGADGVWFSWREGDAMRVCSREQVASHRPLSAILRLIGDEAELSKAPSQALLRSLFQSLAVYVSRMSQAVPLPRWGRPLRDRRIERALELLDRDLSKYWTVEHLARAVGLSRPVFARQFVRMLRLSPMRYLARRRMEVAAELLREGEASLAEIAGLVGYRSEFAFGRAFKQHHGVAPGTFRRQPALACGSVLRMAA